MKSNTTFECGINYNKNLTKDFTPITVSANFAALEIPNWLNNFAETNFDIAKFDTPDFPNWLNNFEQTDADLQLAA